MKTIQISDVTMRQTAGPTLSFREKLELCRLLDRLGVSVIELEGIVQIKRDSLLIKSAAGLIRDAALAVPVGLEPEGVETVWAALKTAKHPRLQVVAPVSPVQMEYLVHKKPAALIEAVRVCTAACKAHTDHVELVAEDATRSDPDFLCQVITAAIEAGAGTVTLCDTAGAMLPHEFAAFLENVLERVPGLADVTLGVSCADDLSMASACAMAAIRRGAGEIKTAAHCVNCIAMRDAVRLLAGKGEQLGVTSPVPTVRLNRTLDQVSRLCVAHQVVGDADETAADAAALTVHDSREAVWQAVEALGYDLSEEDRDRVYAAFQSIAAHRDKVGTRELEAIVATAALQVPAVWQVESYVINTSSTMGATAHMQLSCNGKSMEGLSTGDGPVDAAFKAMEQIVGRHYELDDFQIRAVTEGREAMGETVVKLRSGGRLYAGRGVSTDIGGASIQAYVNALNKIVFEEGAE